MRVHLEAIKFNYDPTFSLTGAFNIRRNETQTVPIPEWEPDVGSDFKASPVAYSIFNLPSVMTLQASFRCEGGPGTPVMVKAVAMSSGHVLGDVQQESIPGNGSSGFIPLKLPDGRTMVSQAGIGFHDIEWSWRFSRDGENWTHFQTTHHRVYTVLARPTEPWRPSADNSNIHQPWTEVLDHACQWAAGVKGLPDTAGDEAARRVSDYVNGLGKTLLMHGSDPAYAHATFDCTAFLELLETGRGKQIVNCEDCATIVSTFANILGASLWQSSMGPPLGFRTNHVIQIGDTHWNPTPFVQHTVAWKGACREQDLLFDSFLQVDGDDEPCRPPRVELKPSGLTFGDPQERFYKFRLVEPGSQCRPTPNDGRYPRQRREFGKSYTGATRITNPDITRLLKQIYSFNSWPKIASSSDAVDVDLEFSARAFSERMLFPGWLIDSFNQFSDAEFRDVIQFVFRRSEADKVRSFAITVYECHHLETANDSLLQIIAAFNQLTLQRLHDPKIGEIAFAEEGQTTIVFRQGRFIGMVGNAGRQSISVERFAVLLYQYLRRIKNNEEESKKPMSTETESSRRTEPETSQPEALVRQESTSEAAVTAHPLAFVFRSFTYSRLIASEPPLFVLRGTVDLRSLTPGGILTAGIFHPVGGDPVIITGKVSEISGVTQVVLSNRYGRYEGFVVRNSSGEVIITGKFITDSALLTQTEEPWVITKP